MPAPEVRVLASDECGLSKLVDLTSRRLLAALGGGEGAQGQGRAREVVRSCWLPASAAEDADEALPLSTARAATLSRAGVVEVWDTQRGAGALGVRLHACAGAGAGGALLAATRGRFVTAAADGAVRVFAQDAADAGPAPSSSSSSSSSSLSSSSASASSPPSSSSPSSFSVGSDLCAAALHRGGSALAVGGRELELAVWDLATGQRSWQAQNVEDDFLGLRVPVWVRALAFLRDPGGGGGAASASPFLLAAASAHRHVRIYDTRSADRRPARGAAFGEHGFTSLCVSGDGRSLVAGDAAGTLRRIDAQSLALTGVFRGPTGSVRALDAHPTLPYVAAVGLDRCLWVFNVHTRQMVRRVYLKQRLNCVLFERPGGFAPLPPASAKSADYPDYAAAAALAAAAGDGDGAGSRMEPEGAAPNAGRKTRLIKVKEAAAAAAAEAAAADAAAAAAAVASSEAGAGAGAGGEAGDGDDDDEWRELDRRAAAAAAAAAAARRKRPRNAAGGGGGGGAAAKEDELEISEEEAEALSDMSGEGEQLEGEEDEDDDVEDGPDDEDEDDEDNEEEEEEDEEEEDDVAALVDSRSAARSLLKHTEEVRAAAGKQRGGSSGGRADAAAGARARPKQSLAAARSIVAAAHAKRAKSDEKRARERR